VNINIPSWLKILIKLGVTTAALYFVIKRIDIGQVGGIIGGSNPLFLTLALLAFIASKLVSAFRLNRYLEAVGVRISTAVNLKLYLLGMFYNLFLPGGIGGDGYKIWYLGRRFEVKTGRIFWAVVMDRVIGVLALFCMAVVFLYFVELDRVWYLVAWILIPLSLVTAYLVTRKFFSYLLPVFTVTNLQSLAVQVLQLISAWMILHAIGMPGQAASYLLVFLVSSIVAVLPITIGGVGSREFTFMLGAQWLNLDLNLSIALSVVFYLITAFTSLFGIIYSVGPGIAMGRRED
jgi:uncharacterized membrane protein YbhN (UPF0104 family)